jgi:hypothetical protein
MNSNLSILMDSYNKLNNELLPEGYESLPDKLSKLLKKYNIKSIFDSGCRNRYWIKHINFDDLGIKYIGGEISLTQVNYCKQEFPSIEVIHHDCTTDQLPHVDLLLSSDVMIHLSNTDKLNFLKNFLSSGITYLLMTDSDSVLHESTINNYCNLNISYRNGFPFADVKWKISPWNFPNELDAISINYSDKRLKLWHRDQIEKIINKIKLGKAVALVAHPDDCVIFALPFIVHYKHFDWHIVYLTYKASDDRAKEVSVFWNKRGVTTEFLGFEDDYKDNESQSLHKWQWTDAVSSISQVSSNYDLILTHNEDGDYGHIHHKVVNSGATSPPLMHIPKVTFASTFNYTDEIKCDETYYSLDELPLHKNIIADFQDRLIGRYIITKEAREILHD